MKGVKGDRAMYGGDDEGKEGRSIYVYLRVYIGRRSATMSTVPSNGASRLWGMADEI